jgi:hypothetical protein
MKILGSTEHEIYITLQYRLQAIRSNEETHHTDYRTRKIFKEISGQSRPGRVNMCLNPVTARW